MSLAPLKMRSVSELITDIDHITNPIAANLAYTHQLNKFASFTNRIQSNSLHGVDPMFINVVNMTVCDGCVVDMWLA